MLFKIADKIRRALQDVQEQRMPKIRYIDGQPYAYCHVRREWRRVKFTDK